MDGAIDVIGMHGALSQLKLSAGERRRPTFQRGAWNRKTPPNNRMLGKTEEEQPEHRLRMGDVWPRVAAVHLLFASYVVGEQRQNDEIEGAAPQKKPAVKIASADEAAKTPAPGAATFHEQRAGRRSTVQSACRSPSTSRRAGPPS